MTVNVGPVDRGLRIVLGIALLAFAWMSSSPYAWLGYIGVIPLLTAAVGLCPLYSLIGVNTRPAKRA
jgi:hypothetical protein